MNTSTFVRLGWICMLCVTAACRTTPRAETETMRPRMRADANAVQAAQAHFDRCTSAFFQDEWEIAEESAEQLDEIAKGWSKQARSLPADDPFKRSAQSFAAAVGRLQPACKDQDINKTANALRDASRHLAALKRLENESTEQEASNSEEVDQAETEE